MRQGFFIPSYYLMNKIEYEIPEAGDVTIKIVDVMGTPVRIHLSRHDEPGKFDFTFDLGALVTGKYYYKIYLTGDSGVNGSKIENNLISSGHVKVNT